METEVNEKYHLSQVFKQHKRSCRTVDALGKFLISGSEDNTVLIYEQQENGQYAFRNEVNMFEKMIYCVKVKQEQDGFFVACQDKNAYVLDKDGSPIMVLEGHQSTVNSISQVSPTSIVTGSWDGTAKLWDIIKGECIRTFAGHSHAVSVLAVSQTDTLVTGSQDKSIRIFTLSTGEQRKEIKNAHSDIIREIRYLEDVGFLSCSNDELVKIWTVDGDEISILTGHKTFVFACNSINFGTYASGGDDKVVNIWKDTTVFQAIDHPSTVWNIAVNKEEDLAVACGDGVLRVFSRIEARKATEQEVKDFENEVLVSNQASQSQGISQEEMAKLPTDPNSVKGTKDGEYKMFRNGSKVEAFMWVMAEQKWEKIGDVTGTGGGAGAGGQMGKKYYPGDQYFKAGEYDYVFDVEDDMGQYKQLPFNEGESSYITARTYCAREGLSFSFQQQIQQFLDANTASGREKQQKAKQVQEAQQFGGQQLQQQQPGLGIGFQQPQQQQAGPVKSKYFPSLQLLKFTNLNKDALLKKTKENNEKLKENEEQNKSIIIQNIEQKRLETLVEFVADPSSIMRNMDTAQWDMLTLKLMKWPTDLRVPVYDLLRVFVMHSQSEKFFTGLDSGMDFLIDMCTMLQTPATPDGVCGVLMKLMCNAFQTSSGSLGLMRNHKIISDAMKVVNKNRTNNNARNSVAALFLDYSVDICQRVSGGQASTINDYIKEITGLGLELLAQPGNSADAELKILVGLGNIADKVKKLVGPIMVGVVSKFKSQHGDQKVDECARDLQALLQQI